MGYVTDSMRREMAGHVLKPLGSGGTELYSLNRPGTIVYSVYIAELAGRLCITGDVCLGANDRGVVSAPGYGIGWFSGELSESYLCEKFLRREWQWDAAVESIRQSIEQDARDGEGWWLSRAAELEAFIAHPSWMHDEPNLSEYYGRMADLGCEDDEMPGFDYPRGQAGWLCAIQQRFRELKSDSCQGMRDPGAADAGAARDDTFAMHLERASSVVRTWPAWKQELLGGTASQPAQRE